MVAVGTVAAAISAEDLLREVLLSLACMLAVGTVAVAILAEHLLREVLLPRACMLAVATEVVAAMLAGDRLREVLVLAIIHRRVLDGAAAEGVNEMGLGVLLCGILRERGDSMMMGMMKGGRMVCDLKRMVRGRGRCFRSRFVEGGVRLGGRWGMLVRGGVRMVCGRCAIRQSRLEFVDFVQSGSTL